MGRGRGGERGGWGEREGEGERERGRGGEGRGGEGRGGEGRGVEGRGGEGRGGIIEEYTSVNPYGVAGGRRDDPLYFAYIFIIHKNER